MNQRLPLFVAMLGLVSSFAVAQTMDSADEVRQWLTSFDREFETRNVSKLERFYDNDVTIFEGSVTNTGWTDYRDNHIGKELAEMSDVALAHQDVAVHFPDESRKWAYVTSHFSLAMTVKGEKINLAGLETLVLRNIQPAGWKIVHSHTSAKRTAPTAQSQGKK